MKENAANPARLLEKAVSGAQAAGCDAAEAVFVESTGESAAVRLGKPEKVARPSDSALGLRVLIGKRQASASVSKFTPGAVEELVERVAAMARYSPEDPNSGLPESEFLLKGKAPDLELCDSSRLKPDELIRLATEAEAAALALTGITNSEGAEAAWQVTRHHRLTSQGFFHALETTLYSLSAVAIAGKGAAMERDYDYTTTRRFKDLAPPEKIGKSAGERALARLNPKRPKTGKAPVVFDRRVSRTLLGHFAAAVNGRQVARGTTFLSGKMGKPVFAKGLTVTDDPLRRRGLASAPFDGEGVKRRTMRLVEDGVLKSWILDTHSARELGLVTTGHAPFSLSFLSSPSPTNLYLGKGNISHDDLLNGIRKGFLVTELIGFGVNPVTGDYSRGASGFWVENGEIAYPVNEVTVAGNLLEMFSHLTPAGDLEFKRPVNAPSVLVEGMTVAGS